MTPDHTPFLRPGVDLITAEDVARWLREQIRAGRTYTYEAADALDARLDRERRQACRRGALEAWCEVARLVRWARRHNWPADVAAERAVWRHLYRALAYRAAARAK